MSPTRTLIFYSLVAYLGRTFASTEIILRDKAQEPQISKGIEKINDELYFVKQLDSSYEGVYWANDLYQFLKYSVDIKVPDISISKYEAADGSRLSSYWISSKILSDFKTANKVASDARKGIAPSFSDSIGVKGMAKLAVAFSFMCDKNYSNFGIDNHLPVIIDLDCAYPGNTPRLKKVFLQYAGSSLFNLPDDCALTKAFFLEMKTLYLRILSNEENFYPNMAPQEFISLITTSLNIIDLTIQKIDDGNIIDNDDIATFYSQQFNFALKEEENEYHSQHIDELYNQRGYSVDRVDNFDTYYARFKPYGYKESTVLCDSEYFREHFKDVNGLCLPDNLPVTFDSEFSPPKNLDWSKTSIVSLCESFAFRAQHQLSQETCQDGSPRARHNNPYVKYCTQKAQEFFSFFGQTVREEPANNACHMALSKIGLN